MKAFIENDNFFEPELVQVAREISANANNLSWYLQFSGHQQPSSLIDTPPNVVPPSAPVNVHSLRQKLKQDAIKLFRLASGPNEFVAHTALNVGLCLFPKKMYPIDVPAYQAHRVTASIHDMPPLALSIQDLLHRTHHRFNKPSECCGHCLGAASSA